MKVIVKKVQVEMLQDRGYTIPPEEQNVTKFKKYNNVYKKNSFLAKGEENRFFLEEKINKTLYVHYLDEDNLTNSLTEFVNTMADNDKGILIGSTPKELEKKKYKEILYDLQLKPYEHFEEQDLYYNVSKHVTVPKHEKINKSTIIPSMVNINQLSKILNTDPIVRYYGWKPGNVIKITRNHTNLNLLVNEDIGYRVVTLHIT
jgi:DNA-directed RNA polymerase subunit H (RpoH/RPB5)